MNAQRVAVSSCRSISRQPVRRAALVAAALGVLPALCARADVTPYTVDANTMHLWHLDEVGTPAADAAHYNYVGAYTNKPDANLPLTALFGGATLGNPSRNGFGNALSVGAPGAGLSALTPANATSDNVDHTFDNPITHAFSFEAMIRIGFDPTVGITRPQEIIAGEGDSADSSDRSWQFRIEANATPSAASPWRLRFQKLSGFVNPDGTQPPGSVNANYNLDANIPSTGNDAIAQDQWYHVAVTFNGDLNDTSNLKLYWTKADDATPVANQIGAGRMNGYLRQQDTDFALGNELRDFNLNTEGFQGLIDEVRISDIARTAADFIFKPAGTTAWNVNANGAWETASNWTAGVPNGVAASASFGSGGTPITAPRTISLSGNKTLGFLTFNNPTQSYTLASGPTAGSLTLDNGANVSSVLVQSGNHTIAVPVTLTANGAAFLVAGSTDSLTLSGAVGGAGSLGKAGAGTLVLTANNAYGNTLLSGGVLQLGNGGASGSLGTGDVTASNFAVLAVNRSGNVTIANNFVGTGGSIRQEGTGVLTLAGTNNFAGGGVIANAGSVRLGSAAALHNGGATLNNGTTLDLNGFGNSGTGGLLAGTGGIVTDNAAGAGTTSFTIGGTGAGDFIGSINDGPTRKIAVTKVGTSTVALRGGGTYSGGTTHTQGFIDVYDGAALGTGPVVIHPAVTVPAVGAEATRLSLGNVTLTNPITMTTSNSGVASGTIQTLNNATATVSGPISIGGNAISGGHFAANGTGLLRVTGPVTAGPAVTTLIVRQGNLEFSGGGSYPSLEIRAGNTALGADNGLATNAVVDLAGNGSATVATVLELAGFNQTLAGLKNAVTVNNAALVVSSVGNSTLTLNVGAGNTQTYGGSISGNVALRVTSGTQVLTKLGTSALNGTYDYNGLTTIDGGTLQLATVAWQPVLGGSGADIRSGQIVFDYAGGTTPAPQISAALDAGYDTNFTSGPLRSSTASSSRGLGWVDDTAGSKLTVAYTLYGDSNLDKSVNFDDLLKLAQNYGGAAGKIWAEGDTNYDGLVNFDDLLKLAQNYGQTALADGGTLVNAAMAASFTSDWALAQSLVPEPATLGMILGFGVVAGRRRRVAVAH